MLEDTHDAHTTLAFSLLNAARVVRLVRSGTALPQALSQVSPPSSITFAQRGAIQDIAYRTLRLMGRAELVLGHLTHRPPEPALLYSLLCAALCLLLETDSPPYETFTVVNQAVTAAASVPTLAHTKGMVNAVLRRFLREREALVACALKTPHGLWNYPPWWINRLQTAYPDDWQTILNAGNTRAPLTLRVNRRRLSVADYLASLSTAGIAGRALSGIDGSQSWAVRLEKPLPVHAIPGFDQGWVSVQDAGAQLAAPLLDLHDGLRVLDACAAPGGKTGHILECANVHLTALDNDEQRLQKVADNCERLQLHATLNVGDAGKTAWWDGTLFDRILADVPCTASGIVRRHPDIRWLRRSTDTEALAQRARQILDNLWSLLAPGGQLLLVTCSVWPEESSHQADAFAQRHGAQRLACLGQLLPVTLDDQDQDHDGLFYARFQKI